jgi:hypothetical protein
MRIAELVLGVLLFAVASLLAARGFAWLDQTLHLSQ